MADNLTPIQRSHCMTQVKGKNTSIEVLVARLLKKRGLYFYQHMANLPGKPDIVFKKEKIAVFLDGDFWHGYRFSAWMSKLKPFWRNKIELNRARDRRNFAKLRRSGWKVIRIWQHSIEKNSTAVADNIEETVLSSVKAMERFKHRRLERTRI